MLSMCESSESVASNALAIVQALDKVTPPREPDGKTTLMERMVGRAYVAPDDWRRAAAANNLYHNVHEMIARCQARGVLVLVCTQPSNERDLAPVGRDQLDPLSEAKRQEFTQSFERGTGLLAQDPAAAVEALQQALAVLPTHARSHFQLGQALLTQNRLPEAHAAFERARDLDSMPWRATSDANDAIRRAARELSAPVCDLEAVFRTNSPGGCG